MSKKAFFPNFADMFFAPFTFSQEMVKVSLQASELMLSSAEVITRRSALISQAATGQMPLNHPEFTRMWQEKADATLEAWNSLSHSLMDTGVSCITSKNLDTLHGNIAASPFKTLNACTNPYQKKVSANVKRLRRTT